MKTVRDYNNELLRLEKRDIIDFFNYGMFHLTSKRYEDLFVEKVHYQDVEKFPKMIRAIITFVCYESLEGLEGETKKQTYFYVNHRSKEEGCSSQYHVKEGEKHEGAIISVV